MVDKNGFPRPPPPPKGLQNLPTAPKVPSPPPPPEISDDTINALMEDVPEQIQDDIQRDVDRIMDLPKKIDQDTATLMALFSRQPGEFMDTLYKLPTQIPKNIIFFFESLKEAMEYEEGDKASREKTRTWSDIVDLFTPT